MPASQPAAHNQIAETLQSLPPLSADALALFRENREKITVFMTEKLATESRVAGREPSVEADFFEKDICKLFGELLLGIYEFELYDHFAQEIFWFASVLFSRGYKRDFFEKLLSSWHMGLHSFIRSAQANELSQPIMILQKKATALCEHAFFSEPPLPEDREVLLNLLLEKNKAKAAEHVIALYRQGQGLETLLSEVIPAVLERVGILWQKNSISVVDQHVATDICNYILFRLAEEVETPAPLPYKALVACVPGEHHELGAEMLEEYLELKGWFVLSMGHIAPRNAVLQAVLSMKPDAVFLSVSMISRLPAALEIVQEIRKLMPGSRIILGGRAARLAENKLAACADAVVASFEEGHVTALELVKKDA